MTTILVPIRHCLALVVGNVDRRNPQPPLQSRDFGTCLHPQLGVQIAQRFVHEEELGLANDGAAEGDTLTLATG